MKRKAFLLDIVGVGIFCICLFYIIELISEHVNTEIINPISQTFADFELTDLVFSKIRESPEVDPNIVLVNIGMHGRRDIADQINILSKYKPKVIGIDARFFYEIRTGIPEEDSMYMQNDSLLAEAFKKAGNVVLGCELLENRNTGVIDSVDYALPMFRNVTNAAYVDMISEGVGRFKTARTHFLRQKLQDKDSTFMLSFAARIAQMYKPESVKAIERRNKDTEIINYRGNINCATKDSMANSKITFGAIDAYDLFKPDSLMPEEALREMLEGKIVIMGYMGPDFMTYSTEDRFFTPLNANYVGKADPDMYGVIVHANIVSMILAENYINEMPDNQVLAVNLFIICLNIVMFLYLYGKLEQFWDGATLLITIFQALLFLTIIVYIFIVFNYKLNFTFAIVALFLMPNVIELYCGIIKATGNKIIDKINHRNTKRKIIVKPEE